MDTIQLEKLESIVTRLQAFIKDPKTVAKYRLKAKYFTRESKLGFANTVYLALYRMKSTMATELYNQLTINGLEPVTDSGFTQSRYKISSNLFADMHTLLLDSLQSEGLLNAELFHGYKIHAVDGTKLRLPNTKTMQAHFGAHPGGTTETPTYSAMCLLMCLYDVRNHYLLRADVEDLKTGEMTVAKNWVEAFDSQAITLFDRGYPSAFLCHQLLAYKKPFVIRAALGFNAVIKAFVASDETDTLLTFDVVDTTAPLGAENAIPKGTKVQVRAVKIILPTGETEVLLTSLFDTEIFTNAVLSELYRMRWGIETAYDTLKNKFLIMCFSGLKPEAIYQDIYATILMHNLQQLFINEAQIAVNERVTACEYRYKVNISVATGIFKQQIIPLFLTKTPSIIIQKMIKIFTQERVPVRPDKKAPPRKKIKSKARNLFTQTNFKRP